MNYFIKYLKSTEDFQIIAPDPLVPNSTILIRISDFDLYSFIRTSQVPELDDDTKGALLLLKKSCFLSANTLILAKRQQHLRKLNRSDSAWLQLKNRFGRKPKSSRSDERLVYLKENFDSISLNCIKHDWFFEFSSLCHDVFPGISKKEILNLWKSKKETSLL